MSTRRIGNGLGIVADVLIAEGVLAGMELLTSEPAREYEKKCYNAMIEGRTNAINEMIKDCEDRLHERTVNVRWIWL